MAKKIKQALVVEPTGEVREFETSASLEELQKLVGGYIELVPWPGGGNVQTWVNEEGLVDNLPHNQRGARVMALLGRADLHYLRGALVFINPSKRVKSAVASTEPARGEFAWDRMDGLVG